MTSPNIAGPSIPESQRGLPSRTLSIALVCAAVLLPLAVLLPDSGPEGLIRTLAVSLFLFTLPGAALLYALRMDWSRRTPGLAVVSSMAMGVVISTLWAYVGNGAWQPAFWILVLITWLLCGWRLVDDIRPETS